MAREDLDRFLGWRQVRELTGLGRTTAWRLRRAGDLPEPVPISPGRVAWRERDIVVWNERRGRRNLFGRGRHLRPPPLRWPHDDRLNRAPCRASHRLPPVPLPSRLRIRLPERGSHRGERVPRSPKGSSGSISRRRGRRRG